MNERYDCQLAELQAALRAARERDQLSYETETLQGDGKRNSRRCWAGKWTSPFRMKFWMQ